MSRAIRVFLAAFVLFFTPALPAQEAGSVVVTVDVGTSGLDPDAVRSAIAKELGVSVQSTDVAGAKGKLAVRIDPTSVNMTYETADGRKLSRVVQRPKDPSEDLEVIALLAGNLARDEAAELLGERAQKPEADAGTAPATGAPGGPSTEPPAKPKVEPKKPSEKPKPASEKARPKASALTHELVNLSLFHPLALHPDSQRYRFDLELGLAYSRIGGLSGFGLTVGALHVDQKAEGFGASLFWTATMGSADGLFASGLFTTSKGRLRGAEGAGLFNYREGPVKGVQGAGIFNHAEDVEGVQGAGILNISRGVVGVQGAGILNLTQGRVRGVTAATVNLNQDVSGLQAGLVNVGGNINGVSIGLVNVSERVDGLSLAPISILSKNRTQALLFTDSVAVANVGVKYDTGPLYSLFTLGGKPGSAEDQKWGGGGAVGVHVVEEGHLFVDLDLLYRYFDEDPQGNHEGSHSTVLRGVVGWDFGAVGVFGGLGGEHRLTPENDHQGRAYGVLGLQVF